MRSTYYPGVCTKPGTYYQDWFMYMTYTNGQNEEYSRTWTVSTLEERKVSYYKGTHYQRYLLSQVLSMVLYELGTEQ